MQKNNNNKISEDVNCAVTSNSRQQMTDRSVLLLWH